MTTVINRDWHKRLASSLATGLAALFENAAYDAVLVTLADQPLVGALALRRLIAEFGGDRRIVASAYNSTMGVPAVFGHEHVGDLMRLTGDAGAGVWLRSRPSEVTCVPLDVGAFDIDTPSVVARLGSISQARG